MDTFEEVEQALRDGDTIYCGACLNPCKVEGRDYGIGAYGYGASISVHSDVCLESACCDSDDLLLESELPEPEEGAGQ